MSKLLIYRAYNIVSKKSYIGKTSDLKRRMRGHHDYATDNRISKYSTIFHKALNSYGKDVFEWTIIAECNTHDELNQLEIKHGLELNTLAPNGYNMTLGGQGMHGYTLSEETRRDISEKIKLLHADPEYQARVYPKLKGLVPPNKGVAMSDEQKSKVSAAKKAVYADPTYINPNVGQKRTGEALKNVQEGHKRRKMPKGEAWTEAHGNQYTNEVRKKMRQAKLSKKPSNTQKVFCIETKTMYSGLTEAAKLMNLPRQSIWMQIKGKLKQVRGFTFKYLDTLIIEPCIKNSDGSIYKCHCGTCT